MLKRNAADKANAEFRRKGPSSLAECSDAQIDKIVEHMRRSFVMRKKAYHLCRDRTCRRERSCLARQGRCVCENLPLPTARDGKRAKRDFRRNPPRV